jgi:hypothetical protein
MENYTFKNTFLAWIIPKKSLVVLGGYIFFQRKNLWVKGQPREIGKRLLVVLKNQKPIWSSNYGSLKMNEPVKGSSLIFCSFFH